MKKDILYINSVDDIRIIDTLRVLKEHDYSKDYLTFEALEDGAFAYTICYTLDPEMEDIPLSLLASAKLQYSFNGKNWVDWVRPNLISESINVLANQKLYIRGYTKPIEDAYGTVKFSSTCRFNVCGLLSSLLYGYNYEDKDFILTKQPMEDTHFVGLFDSCDKLISAENLILPQELVRECYIGMFYYCTALTIAPELPATTLADGCYNSMFYGCSSLNYIKAMFTTTPSTSYTNIWVSGVAATGTFVKNSAATWNVTGVNGIPTGWTVETATE